ncbi:hypothetical protein ACP275_14G193800 [Erythranthe tilingii]
MGQKKPTRILHRDETDTTEDEAGHIHAADSNPKSVSRKSKNIETRLPTTSGTAVGYQVDTGLNPKHKNQDGVNLTQHIDGARDSTCHVDETQNTHTSNTDTGDIQQPSMQAHSHEAARTLENSSLNPTTNKEMRDDSIAVENQFDALHLVGDANLTLTVYHSDGEKR